MAQITKKSKQRDAIINFLKSRNDHPTADIVYMNIKQEFPNISLGTVYRNLAMLAENGDIVKLSYDGKADRFDGNTTQHYHFLCKKCSCISDIENMPNIDFINDLAEKNIAGHILGYNMFFYGICSDCLANENT